MTAPASPVEVVRALRARARALGVTRLGRVTGLDRAGVEVACAIRPLGHVLQLCNGKGATFAQAAASALSEAAELEAAEHPDPLRLRYASVAELRGRADHVPPDRCGSAGELVAPELYSETTRLGWISGRSLRTGREALVLAQAVHCPPADGPQLGPSLVRWTSNGLGAHVTRARALRHALLEVLERDELEAALPRGWTAAQVRRRMVRPSGGLERLARSMRSRRLELYLFDLTPAARAVPLGGALLFDGDGGQVPLAAGYACRPRLEDALRDAAYEAAQSRLTDIHGAREDVEPTDPTEAAVLLRACRAARPRRAASPATVPIPALEAVVVDLGTWAGLQVVKVVAPGLRCSRLL
ncbi:MAG TPA: YcaO-like family protein [Myxococcales bacterium]|nr:YcaO-like family protein [Myxococcales bacterium]